MPTPTLPAAPCFVCDQDYLSDPSTRQAVMSADLPEGCECPGCVVLRAEVTASTSDAPIPAVDGINFLAPLRVSITSASTLDPWSVGTPREVTVGLCPAHTAAVQSVMNTDRPCGWCSALSRETLADMGIAMSNENGRALPVTQIRLGTRGAMLLNAESGRRMPDNLPRVGVGYNVQSYSEAATLDDGTTLCDSCYATAEECESCNRLMNGGSEYYCEDCEENVCYSCWDGSHYRHRAGNNDEGSIDNDRHRFAARMTIREALNRLSAPGATILSTRALGIEVETSRGSCGPVIAAERDAVFPILAGVGTDGSVRGRNAVEYRLLPVRGAVAEFAIRSMAQWCRDAGYAPDSSAGIHMHVDCSDLSAANVWRAFAALVALEGVLFSHAAPERLASQYCTGFGTGANAVLNGAVAASRRNPSFFDYNEVSIPSRYRSINCQAYSSHQTIEVRVFDSCHDLDAVARYTDAAAIIAGAVDFAVSDDWETFTAGISTDRTATAMRLLGSMVASGHITAECFARASSRLDSRMLAASAA
jgi:hypothetical protein